MSKVKDMIYNLPGIKKIKRKFDLQEARMDKIQSEYKLIAYENIGLRLQLKRINNEKIRVVFVCHRPSLWESLHSVYDALKADERFEVLIVAIPSKDKKSGVMMEHEDYTCEGAEEFWKGYGCINGYDYEKKEWLDLRELKPDYVFFQQPYNIIRSAKYKSAYVSLFARILYIPYGSQIIGEGIVESTNPRDFMQDVYCYFSPETYAYDEMRKWLADTHAKIVLTGFPRYDQFRKEIKQDAEIWKYKGDKKRFRIMWTPRWCTGEGNCTFFDYYHDILEYARQNKEVEILFRPHPQAFREWRLTGEFTQKQEERFREECAEVGIGIDEEGEYVSKLMTTDCFLTDPSSLMGEYFVTGKPIIYSFRKDCFTKFGELLSEGYYNCKDWNEIKQVLQELQNGKDVKQPIRKKIMKEVLAIPQEGIGSGIKDYIIKESGF